MYYGVTTQKVCTTALQASGTISTLFYLFVLCFFRSPKREAIVVADNELVCPSDGKVVVVEEVLEPAYFGEKRIQVSIFMSVFNVHANWYPLNGTVVHSSHQNGRFMGAYLPKSSTENERSTVVVRSKSGVDVLFRQVAGAIARRIVTYAKEGDKANVHNHMGFIKFGSRVDIYLPLGTEILVSLNEKTVGGQTLLARLKEPTNV